LNAIVVAFLVAFGVLIQALPAHGCSCAPPNPYAGLADADGAFVGTLVDVDRGVLPLTDSGQLIDFYFEVEATLKGDIGETVLVKSASDGAACGIEVPIGTRAGFLLYPSDGHWEGNLCATLDADALLSAAEGLPEPVAGSPPHLIVAAEMGMAGLVAIDRQGRIVGYGEAPFPYMVSSCPDDETFIGSASDPTVKVWSYTDLGLIDQHQIDPSGTAWINELICSGPGGKSFLATKGLSGLEGSSLVHYADDAAEVVAEDIERLVPTTDGPVAVGSDGVIYRVDLPTGNLTALNEPIGDVKGQVVAAVPSPDGSHLALSAMDFDTNPYEGRVYVIDLEDGESVEKDFACDIYPIWLDSETLLIQDHCTTEVGVIYSTDLEALGEGEAPDYAYTAFVTDETGALFYPSEFAIRVVEPGTEESTEIARLVTYPGAILVVPESVRPKWEGSVVTALVQYPPTTFMEAPAPGVPGPEAVASETPAWLLFLALISAGGVFWLLLHQRSEPT
jgi:hypothetical protein